MKYLRSEPFLAVAGLAFAGTVKITSLVASTYADSTRLLFNIAL